MGDMMSDEHSNSENMLELTHVPWTCKSNHMFYCLFEALFGNWELGCQVVLVEMFVDPKLQIKVQTLPTQTQMADP